MEFRILDIEDIDMRDFPDFCDAHCIEAEVLENGEWRNATEEELDVINNDYIDSVNETIHEKQLYL
jgi:hypothetical protein